MNEQGRQIIWDATDGEHSETDAYYHAQWRLYSIRRNLALFFLYAWLPVTLGLFYFSRMVIHQPEICLAIIFVWLMIAVALVWWAGEFRCPRCRRRYAALGHNRGGTSVMRGLFDKLCSNCKLRKFERRSVGGLG